nr:hypothetical protein [Tanacetum cinerariifolium]
LSATAKGKQPSRATTPFEPTDIQRTKAEQLKIVLKRRRQETHISQQSGSGIDEGTVSKQETVKAGAGKDDDDDDDEEEELAKDDDEETETGKGGDEVRESKGESDEEETRQEEEESFDPI